MGLCMNGVFMEAEYLVLSREGIMAQDLAQSLADFDPQARVHRVVSQADALALIESSEALRVAFVQLSAAKVSLEQMLDSELARLMRERRGKLVLVGEDDVPVDPLLLALPMPFTTEAIMRTLLSIGD